MTNVANCPTQGFLKVFLTSVMLLSGAAVIAPFGQAGAQTAGLFNVNPDPNGEPWIAGGVTKEEWAKTIEGLPSLVLTRRGGLGKAVLAPAATDNSLLAAFRPIFNQQGGSCSQASSIGYVFTYEMNWFRGVAGNVPENQYPYDFSYNFLNSGNGANGAMPDQGFSIAMAVGIPTVSAYGGFGLGMFTQWVSGYNIYLNGMANRPDSQFIVKVNTPAGISTMREWLSNHGNGSPQGGCLVFCYDATGSQIVSLAAGTPQAGKKVMIANGSGGGHAVTIAGYDDSVRYDYNGDGKYTNGTDVTTWEIGAIIMVNSWGTSFGNTGRIYVPYRFCANGMWSSTVYGMRVTKDTTKPLMTYKVSLSHNNRSQIRIRAGYAAIATATAPTGTPKTFGPAFNYCGGSYAMQGINSNPMEIGLDVTDFIPKLTGSDAALFLLVDSKGGTGTVQRFSLLDYTGGPTPVEVVCAQQNVNLPTGTTTLKITKTLSQLMVLTPNGGETWERERTFPITWFDRLTENVKIELLKAGTVVSTINASAPSTGTYQWAVPAAQTIGTDYKIRISSVNTPTITDVSDNNFSIQAKSTLDLTSPAGGEYLEKGRAAVITWNSNVSGNIKIDLYSNRIFDTTIAAAAPNSGSYTWTIPTKLPSGFEYSVRITSVNNSFLYDESDNYFAIVHPIVMAPYTQAYDAIADTVVPAPWEQGVDDDINWTVWQGPTPSKVSSTGGGTGPNGDHTSGSGKYVYLEASSNNHPGKLGVLLAPVVNISRLTNVQIRFWCHMYSRDGGMGSMWVDVNVDGTWKDSVLYLTGNHGDAWFQNTLQLSQVVPLVPSPKYILLRFRDRTGTDYDSDICLDDFSVTGTTVAVDRTNGTAALEPRMVRSGGDFLKLHNVKGAVSFYTLNGAKVMQVPVTEGNGVISIAALPAGLYLARINGRMVKFAK
jgi:hypothetical protein